MKTRQIIIIAVILVILGLIYIPILTSDKTEEKEKNKKQPNYLPILKAANEVHTQVFSAYGQITGGSELEVSMQVQGEIDRDNRKLKVGSTFKKNEILIKVDRIQPLYNLLSRRSSFINLITGILPDIYLDFPDQQKKWDNYLSKVSATAPLPELPETFSQKEKLLIHARNIPTEYYAIKALEKNLENYFYVAPFDGTIVESFVEPGSMVTPGMRVLKISKVGEYEVKAPVNIENLPLFQAAKEIFYTGPKGDTLGKGALLRVSKAINQQTQSVDAFFSIQPFKGRNIILGSFVNLNLRTPLFNESVVLPEQAVYNGKIQILRDSLIHVQNIEVVGTKPDSLYVRGIENGASVVLEPYKNPQDSTKFVGITK
ncbi:MAG: HlyD family efflux transporter periplasmic adaptor subunit [Brumimicrobium sp.]|nr:HlyD family efflux transporter periplasmic adaptor subunit [Brumimicrobium sp.]